MKLAAARARMQQAAAEPAVFTPCASVQYGLLKQYCRKLRDFGLQELAAQLAATPETLPGVAAELGEATKMCPVEADDTMIIANSCAYTSTSGQLITATTGFNEKELVIHVGACEQEHIHAALQAFCKIVEGVVAIPGKNAYALTLPDCKILGGWSDSREDDYNEVRLPAGTKFSREEQNCVVFAVGRHQTKQFAKHFGLLFVEKCIAETVDNIVGGKGAPFTIEEVHVLFGFNPHAVYSFHKDAPDMESTPNFTMMVMLSPGASTLIVAGAEREFTYKFPGAMALFDAVQVFHSSGNATARTLKLAFFVKLTVPIELSSEDEDDDGSNAVAVKFSEVKQEDEPSSSQGKTALDLAAELKAERAASAEKNLTAEGSAKEARAEAEAEPAEAEAEAEAEVEAEAAAEAEAEAGAAEEAAEEKKLAAETEEHPEKQSEAAEGAVDAATAEAEAAAGVAAEAELAGGEEGPEAWEEAEKPLEGVSSSNVPGFDWENPTPYTNHEEVDALKPITQTAGDMKSDEMIDAALRAHPEKAARLSVTDPEVTFAFSRRVVERARALAPWSASGPSQGPPPSPPAQKQAKTPKGAKSDKKKRPRGQ